MRAGPPAGKHRAGVRFDRDHFDRRIALLEHFSDSGQGTSGADSGDQRIDPAAGVAPDLLGGGGAVAGRVGRVFKLLRNKGARRPPVNFVSPGDGPFHTGGSVGQDQLRAVRLEQLAPLDAHGFGHGQDQFIPFDRRDHRQADAGIAAGRLDDQRPRFQHAALFRVLDHGQRDPVLHTAARIEGFHLGDDFRFAFIQAVDPHQRSIPDQFSNSIRNSAHNNLSSILKTKYTLLV